MCLIRYRLESKTVVRTGSFWSGVTLGAAIVTAITLVCRIAGAADLADLSDSSVNVADVEEHPYADPDKSREDHRFAEKQVNEARLYDFYARQADYYMARRDRLKRSKLLPAYPGLDAGLHGHWGKYNQNRHSDNRVNSIKYGGLHLRHIAGQPRVYNNGQHFAVVELGHQQQLSAVFSWTAFGLTGAWTDAALRIPGHRWGLPRPAKLKGKARWTNAKDNFQPHWRRIDAHGNVERIPEGQRRYRGVYRHGRRSIFHYELAGIEVLDAPWALPTSSVAVLSRTLQLRPTDETTASGLEIKVLPAIQEDPQSERVVEMYAPGHSRPDTQVVRSEDGNTVLRIEDLSGPRVVKLYMWAGPKKKQRKVQAAIKNDRGQITDPKSLIAESPEKWTERLRVQGRRGGKDGPLAIDTIPLPFENPYDSVMMLTGIDFLPNGNAAVCTLLGDVWIVSGLTDSLAHVTWERFAAGLYQPFGLEAINGTINVMTTPYIVALHDRNDDREADYRQVVTHDVNKQPNHFIPYRGGGHGTSYGLEVDAKGNFIFALQSTLHKYMRNYDKTDRLAFGLRNPMAFERMPDGRIVVGTQEGTWTPASIFSLIRYGDFYGAGGGPKNRKITVPTAYVPRGIDNSTGGFVGIPDGKWGPFGGKILGLSYGYGTQFLGLLDESTDRPQGATVPLDGAFRSGVVRGEFRSQDGHLYVVGTEGWGNYSLDDGCLHRVRYTGEPLRKPIGFQIYRNGIQIDFALPLKKTVAENRRNYFVQMWDYEYASRYGSPEFSVRKADKLGHDLLEVRSVHRINDGKSVFLEIPRLRPASVVHVRMHLRTAKRAKGGALDFRTSLFPTVRELGQQYSVPSLELAPPVKGKPEELELRGRNRNDGPKKTPSKSKGLADVDRKVVVKAVSGLQYNRTRLTAKAGERLAIKLVNSDPAMPHNLVLAQPGAYEKVGKAGMKMLNDPRAAEKHYVPSLPEVIAHTEVIMPNQTSTIVVQLPKEPGK